MRAPSFDECLVPAFLSAKANIARAEGRAHERVRIDRRYAPGRDRPARA
jgi:hypothetical protein